MKMNELSDKELRDIFQEQKRSYHDDFFSLQLMRKINMLSKNPFKRIMALCSGFYILYFILMFFPAVRSYITIKMQIVSEQLFNTAFKPTDFYLIYVFLMLLLIAELVRIIRNDYKSIF